MEAERSLSPFAVAMRQARLSKTLAIADVMKATLLSDRQIIGLETMTMLTFITPLSHDAPPRLTLRYWV